MPDSAVLAGWLTQYLALGAVVLLAMHVHGRVRRKTFAQQLALLIEKAQLARLPPRQRRLRRFMTFGVILPFAWMNWPLMLVFKLWYEFRQWRMPKMDEPPCERLQRHTIQDLEARHRASDPLTGRQVLPFGDLNDHWEYFKRQQQPGDEIWSIRMSGQAVGLNTHDADGYAILRQGKAVAVFWTAQP